MPSDELLKSWARTRAFLNDARAHISEAEEGICADQIIAYEEYLEHNELELALDMLDEVVTESKFETPHMIELMAKAALSMGLADRVKKYDGRLTEWRGWGYHTKIE
jgi:hypothetical protein